MRLVLLESLGKNFLKVIEWWTVAFDSSPSDSDNCSSAHGRGHGSHGRTQGDEVTCRSTEEGWSEGR